mgnify:CR=1 FL=1
MRVIQLKIFFTYHLPMQPFMQKGLMTLIIQVIY